MRRDLACPVDRCDGLVRATPLPSDVEHCGGGRIRTEAVDKPLEDRREGTSAQAAGKVPVGLRSAAHDWPPMRKSRQTARFRAAGDLARLQAVPVERRILQRRQAIGPVQSAPAVQTVEQAVRRENRHLRVIADLRFGQQQTRTAKR